MRLSELVSAGQVLFLYVVVGLRQHGSRGPLAWQTS